MSWLRRLGWVALTVATLAVAAAVYVVRLPLPTGTIVVDRVRDLSNKAQGNVVSLPSITYPIADRQPDKVDYAAHFDLAALPDGPLYLLIPLANRPVSLALHGEPLFQSDAHTLWSGPLVGNAMLALLPRALLVAGRNDLTVVLDIGQFIAPIYLSRIYIGREAQIAPYFKLRLFLENRLKTMAMAAHVLLGFGIILAFFYRPKDPLFAWLAGMVAVSFALSVAMFVGFEPDMGDLLPYIAALAPALGFLTAGFAFALIGSPVPSALRVITVAVPAMSMLALFSDIPYGRLIVMLVSVALLIVIFIAAAGVVAWGAFRRRSFDARLMLPVFFLVVWFLIRDVLVTAHAIDRPLVLIIPYVRPFFLAALTAMLMRRLAVSLSGLDRANETLNLRLAEREAELAVLHREERLEAARVVREQERQRLTHDLHDGISGHLVSIIAMSERAGEGARPIEQAAREALDDLRLVIYSLDLGDRELPLALANFRERLIPRLQRIGVELDWSTANLPEVSGVTPANALTILRILQEAITNALKHGPARKIAVRAASAPDGMVAIAVENDGKPFVASKTGFGLDNMRRRAHRLRGEVQIGSGDRGVILTLLLPLRLPDFQVEQQREASDETAAPR